MIPHASVFAYLIIAGELFIGITMIVAAVVWLVRWDTLSVSARTTLGYDVEETHSTTTWKRSWHASSGTRRGATG